MATPPIKIAAASDERKVIDVMVLSFSADPGIRWAYPDPHQYLTSFPEFARVFGGKAFEHGTAHYLDGFSGAALWLPPGVQPDEEALIAVLQRTVFERDQEDMFSVFEQMGAFHPTEPHWHLPLIGVDPIHQYKGYGAALLRHALAMCDRDGVPAYLEATSPESVPLYERHGFEVLGVIQAGMSPPITPMLRRPRSV